MLDTQTRIHLPTTDYRQAKETKYESRIMPPCRCCQDQSHHKEHQNVPKLLRYESFPYDARSRADSLDLEDHRKVSVIRKAIDDVSPRPIKRKSSVSSMDQQSVDSFHSEKSYDYQRSISPISRSSDHTNRYYQQEDYYRSLRLSSPPIEVRREKLTVLQNENERSRNPICDSYFNRDLYRDIPSPNYPLPPTFMYGSANHAESGGDYTFTPYLDSNLRQKYTELSDFSIKKRHRTIFTPSQLRKLEDKFNECNFIVGVDRSALAKQLKLKEHQVKIWFQNRRTKVKQLGKDKPLNGEVDVIGL